MIISPSLPTISNPTTEDIAECGCRFVNVTKPDGTIITTAVPLTLDEFLHPQEGYHLPNSTFHDDIAGTAKDLLTRRYEGHDTVGVYRDLVIKWDISDLRDHCPDTFVAMGIRNKHQNRPTFVVADEDVRPTFIIEVVSPRYRQADREIKVVQYARAQVQEYVIIDRRRQRGQELDEILGYRLVEGHYQPITPDEEGRIFCETVGLWLSFVEGSLVMEDAQTGERLLTSSQLAAANLELTTTNQELAATHQELATAKEEVERQAAEIEALLAKYQERFGNLPENQNL
jgi:Uma2 family endonuclease